MSDIKYSAATTIITFDLHGVVSNPNYWQIVSIGLCNAGSIVRLGLYAFNPIFLKKVWRLWRSHAVAAAYLHMVSQHYPFLKPAIGFLINVGNAQKPNHEMIEFIKRLKQYGYTVHLFSNIGDFILEDFAKKYPDILSLFDAICNTDKADKYIGKPYDAAFVHYQTHCNPTNKQIIFIDNTKRNIAAAQRHGMITVLHTNIHTTIETVAGLLTISSH